MIPNNRILFIIRPDDPISGFLLKIQMKKLGHEVEVVNYEKVDDIQISAYPKIIVIAETNPIICNTEKFNLGHQLYLKIKNSLGPEQRLLRLSSTFKHGDDNYLILGARPEIILDRLKP